MLFSPPQMPPSKPSVITVWIHGTKPEECLPSPFAKLAKRIGNMIFHSKPGLVHANVFNTHHYDAIRASALASTEPTLFQAEYIYSFGWSGKLNLPARKNASQELFCSLKTLVQYIEQETGLTPEIILIAHSHGGNVVLHLAEIKDPDGFELVISKAILLACPVQKDTAHLIYSPIFQRIYSLHSHTDMIQIVDMQGLHRKRKSDKPLFSERHFDPHPKLVQAHIRWKNCPTWNDEDIIVNKVMLKRLTDAIKVIDHLKKNRGLFHVEFILLPFIRQLGSVISRLDLLFDTNSNCDSHRDHDIIIEL